MGIDMKCDMQEFLKMSLIVITLCVAVILINELADNYKVDHVHANWEASRQHYMEQCECYVPPVNMDSIRAGILPEWNCE